MLAEGIRGVPSAGSSGRRGRSVTERARSAATHTVEEIATEIADVIRGE